MGDSYEYFAFLSPEEEKASLWADCLSENEMVMVFVWLRMSCLLCLWEGGWHFWAWLVVFILLPGLLFLLLSS